MNLDSDEMKIHYKFMIYMKQNGANIRKTSLRIYAENYRGLHSAVRIKRGENIIEIPLSLTVSYKNLEEHTEIGKKLKAANTFDNKWRRFIFPLIYLMEERKRQYSKYKYWLEVIPAEDNTHPMFFTEEELQLLKGSPDRQSVV